MGKIIRTMESPKVFGEIVCRIPLTFLPRHVDQVGRQEFSSINLGHIFMRLRFFLHIFESVERHGGPEPCNMYTKRISRHRPI